MHKREVTFRKHGTKRVQSQCNQGGVPGRCSVYFKIILLLSYNLYRHDVFIERLSVRRRVLESGSEAQRLADLRLVH